MCYWAKVRKSSGCAADNMMGSSAGQKGMWWRFINSSSTFPPSNKRTLFGFIGSEQKQKKVQLLENVF